MSYTTLDWLHDRVVEPTDLIDRLREDDKCVIRRADVDALVRVAREAGYDPADQGSAWESDADVLLALENWEKERRDWVPEDGPTT